MFIEMLDDGPKRVFLPDPPPEIPEHVDPDHVSETAHNDKHHGIVQDQRICLIADQAVRPQDIDACVTESGNRRKDGVPDALPHTKLRDKRDHVDQRADHFHHKGPFEYSDQESFDTVHGVQVKGIMDQKGTGQGQFLMHHQHKDSGHCYDPKAAQLDQDQDHDLPRLQ